MATVIDLRSLDPRFQSGLVFSFFEGLLQGNKFKLILGQDPNYIKDQFSDAKITNAQMNVSKIDNSTWEVSIEKINEVASSHQSGGCCGVCGSHQES